MSERHQGLVIAFERDLDDEELVRLRTAIHELRNVLSTTPIPLDVPGDWIARERVRKEIGEKLWDVISPGGR